MSPNASVADAPTYTGERPAPSVLSLPDTERLSTDKRPTVVSGADAFSGRRGCYIHGCRLRVVAVNRLAGKPYTPCGPYRCLHVWRDCSCQSPAAHVTRYPHFPHSRPHFSTRIAFRSNGGNVRHRTFRRLRAKVRSGSTSNSVPTIRGTHVPGTLLQRYRRPSATWHLGRNAECLPSWSLHVARPHISARPTTIGET